MSGNGNGGKQRKPSKRSTVRKGDPPKPVGELVVPSHGVGRIWRGRCAHPVAGPGRTASALRQQFTKSLAERKPLLEEFADARLKLRTRCEKCGHTPEPTAVDPQQPQHSDRLRALDLMGKYGPGTTSTVNLDDVTGRLEEQYRVLMEELEPKVFETVSARLAEVWR